MIRDVGVESFANAVFENMSNDERILCILVQLTSHNYQQC